LNESILSNLFTPNQPDAPLAERLRPKTLDEVVGQSHLLATNKPLRLAFQSGKLPSMILWGPPGVGKTTLARLIANTAEADFIPISAVLSGIKDIREAVERAELTLQQHSRKTILFVDEVHRFNKGQQDAFLPFVESGLITFIGATTENPSFEVNSALLSRAQVFVLNALSEAELSLLLDRAQQLVAENVKLADEVREQVLAYADGDARRLLNFIEGLFNAAEASLRLMKPFCKPPWRASYADSIKVAKRFTTKFPHCINLYVAQTQMQLCIGSYA
jgi:putative ATPase